MFSDLLREPIFKWGSPFIGPFLYLLVQFVPELYFYGTFWYSFGTVRTITVPAHGALWVPAGTRVRQAAVPAQEGGPGRAPWAPYGAWSGKSCPTIPPYGRVVVARLLPTSK